MEHVERLLLELAYAFGTNAEVGAIGTRARKSPPSSADIASWEAQKRLRHGDFSEAAEGTRTLDLLHGKQTL